MPSIKTNYTKLKQDWEEARDELIRQYAHKSAEIAAENPEAGGMDIYHIIEAELGNKFEIELFYICVAVAHLNWQLKVKRLREEF